MSINRLDSIWCQRLLQARPKEHLMRARTLAWLITAIFQGRSVQWSLIATTIPTHANLLRVVRR